METTLAGEAVWQEHYLPFVSRLKSIDTFVLDAIQREVRSPDIEWHEPYSEYASPGLQVAVLFSPDGQENNFSWKDCQTPQKTALLKRLNTLEHLLDGFGFNIMASRLLKLLPGTFLHEHRDYVYLEDVPRFRLHVPIVTNKNAHIVMPGTQVHLNRGFLWKLNPKASIHSASNFGSEPRIHLMLDVYLNDALQELVAQESLPVDSIKRLPRFTEAVKEKLVAQGRQLLEAGEQDAAEDLVLRQFCLYDLEGATSYQLLHEVYSGSSGSCERLEYWRRRSEDVYPVIAH